MKIYHSIYKLLTLVFSASYLLACSTNSYDSGLGLTERYKILVQDNTNSTIPFLDDSIFEEIVHVEPTSEIFRLSAEQELTFRNYLELPENKKYSEFEKTYRYIENMADEYEYINQTNNASVALETKSGNCLSLAILTVALAQQADVAVGYQLVIRPPIYQKFGSVILKAQHIRTVLWETTDNTNRTISRFRRKAIVDYYPNVHNKVKSNISDNDFIAMYYRNISSEALAKQDYQTSYYYALESLNFDPMHEDTLNNLAVINRRIGKFKKAEEIYVYGIKSTRNNISLMRNYRILLQSQNRVEEAGALTKILDQITPESPFELLKSANDAYNKNDFKVAITHYKEVIEMAPYIHQAHFGIASANYKLGNNLVARLALKKAIINAPTYDEKSLYVAKLKALN